MTDEDKKIISEYMGWKFDSLMSCYRCVGHYSDPVPVHFDSNDASLCVEKMVENGDIEDFLNYSYANASYSLFVVWLFNPNNFFSTMASWLRGKQYTPSIRTR